MAAVSYDVGTDDARSDAHSECELCKWFGLSRSAQLVTEIDGNDVAMTCTCCSMKLCSGCDAIGPFDSKNVCFICVNTCSVPLNDLVGAVEIAYHHVDPVCAVCNTSTPVLDTRPVLPDHAYEYDPDLVGRDLSPYDPRPVKWVTACNDISCLRINTFVCKACDPVIMQSTQSFILKDVADVGDDEEMFVESCTYTVEFELAIDTKRLEDLQYERDNNVLVKSAGRD